MRKDDVRMMRDNNNETIGLTTHCRRIEECFHNSWIHCYSKVLLGDDAGVPCLNPRFDPSFELVLDDGVDDVAKELLWQFFPFLLLW